MQYKDTVGLGNVLIDSKYFNDKPRGRAGSFGDNCNTMFETENVK